LTRTGWLIFDFFQIVLIIFIWYPRSNSRSSMIIIHRLISNNNRQQTILSINLIIKQRIISIIIPILFVKFIFFLLNIIVHIVLRKLAHFLGLHILSIYSLSNCVKLHTWSRSVFNLRSTVIVYFMVFYILKWWMFNQCLNAILCF
jgi:hypothetical protein